MEKCPICGKESKNKAGLSLHMKNMHKDQTLNENKAAEKTKIRKILLAFPSIFPYNVSGKH